MIGRRALLSTGSAALLSGCLTAHTASPEPLGVTTVGFRERFRQTASNAAAVDLELVRWPAFVRETFDVTYVELWSRHFDELTLAYCERLYAAARDSGTRIVNIQLDPFDADQVDMAETDQARRLADIDKVKAWMDRSRACGAWFLRGNTDKPTEGRPFDVNVIADSFRRLAEYGETIGVTILVENHGGYSRDISKVEAVVRAVDHRFCRALPDWGNSPGDTTAARIASLAPLAPLAALVSAKGKTFDETTWTHLDYDVAALTEAVARSGYGGIYSVELYAVPGPSDPVAAVRSMIAGVREGIRRAHT